MFRSEPEVTVDKIAPINHIFKQMFIIRKIFVSWFLTVFEILQVQNLKKKIILRYVRYLSGSRICWDFKHRIDEICNPLCLNKNYMKNNKKSIFGVLPVMTGSLSFHKALLFKFLPFLRSRWDSSFCLGTGSGQTEVLNVLNVKMSF